MRTRNADGPGRVGSFVKAPNGSGRGGGQIGNRSSIIYFSFLKFAQVCLPRTDSLESLLWCTQVRSEGLNGRTGPGAQRAQLTQSQSSDVPREQFHRIPTHLLASLTSLASLASLAELAELRLALQPAGQAGCHGVAREATCRHARRGLSCKHVDDTRRSHARLEPSGQSRRRNVAREAAYSRHAGGLRGHCACSLAVRF